MTQPASAYTQVPNWLIEAMPKMTGAQVMVCLAVARRTLGWQKDADTISLSQLHDDTGLDRETLIEATRWLSDEAKILTRTPAPRSGFTYQLTYQSEIPTSRKNRLVKSATSRKNRPDLVGKSDPQYKEKERTRVFAANAASAQAASAPDEPSHPAEVSQHSLIGLPEQAPPGSAAPPPAAPARKLAAPRKPKATPEQAAIRQALRLAANWGPGAKANAQAAANGDALMAFDPGVTPERIALFARRWFPRYSPVAIARAARQDTAPADPTPDQVAQYWPGFVAWEQAQAAAASRARQEEVPEERRPITAEERAENRRMLQEAMRNGFGGGGHSAAPAARPALMAAPRRAT